VASVDDRFERYQRSLQEGHEQAHAGRLKQALERYRAAAALAQGRPLPHVLSGAVLLRMGRPKEALAEYDAALKLEPNDVAALEGRLTSLRALGRTADAQATGAHLARLEREAEARQLAAVSAGSGGQPEAMLVLAERAHAQGDDELATDSWLRAAAGYAADDHIDAALDTCLRALLVDPGSPRIHLALCRLYFARGWRERAIEHLALLDRLLELEPDAKLRQQLKALAGEHAAEDARAAAIAGG